MPKHSCRNPCVRYARPVLDVSALCTSQKKGRHVLCPRPAMPFLAAELAENQPNPVVLIAPTTTQAQQWADEATFWQDYLGHDIFVQFLPPWDIQPYDKLTPSPNSQALHAAPLTGRIICTTAPALFLKRSPQVQAPLAWQVGQEIPFETIAQTLVNRGYTRTHTVTDAGEFALRGGICDIYPPTAETPFRLEWLDDELERIQPFDPSTQRSITGEKVKSITLSSATTVPLTESAISHFRTAYRALTENGDTHHIYESISNGSLPIGGLNYLPILSEQPLKTVFEELPANSLILHDAQLNDALHIFHEGLMDAYENRLALAQEDTSEDFPLLPEALYATEADWNAAKARHGFIEASELSHENTNDVGLKTHSWPTGSTARIHHAQQFETPMLFGQNDGQRKRLEQLFPDKIALAAPVQEGFITPEDTFVTFGDLFGVAKRANRKGKRGADFAHIDQLAEGDYVVHEEFGIAKFVGVQQMAIDAAKQDFLVLQYAGQDKVFVPVENLHVISRHSGADAGVVRLDKLGSTAWQARKAKVKEDLLAMAQGLMHTAAARFSQQRPAYAMPATYDAFSDAFPYALTTDQQKSVDEIIADMTSVSDSKTLNNQKQAFGAPMDRVLVGDVGFGKTEVAMRAAYIALANGKQVAVVCPTTVLARQHFQNFTERFGAFTAEIGGKPAMLSRLVSTADAKKAKANLASGEGRLVIGTHALLAESIDFHDLGLVIIDEEHRFGVKHKERLKDLRDKVDILTLSATPIPRTLNMAMGGLRGLSTITTPPSDRLPVNTHVLGEDAPTLRRAILREVYRGGQVYCVVPRIQDMAGVAKQLKQLVPDAKVIEAHGQMSPAALEDAMNAFYDGAANILLSTTIVESGIDVPTANTLIVFRSDRFGLSQLYQLRGRVGRSHQRAYAYFLLPQGGLLSPDAAKRLQVLQKLQGLGAGFQLAQYDLDIRGAGNLVGKQQSGHIKEIGFSLYSKLLKQAIAQLKDRAAKGGKSKDAPPMTLEDWVPQLSLGFSYRIPETYVPDEPVRLQLYREIANLKTDNDVTFFQEMLQDRFGLMPQEVQHLLAVVTLRNLCQRLGIDRLKLDDLGIQIGFHKNTFANPDALLDWIGANPARVRIRPDQTLFITTIMGSDTGKKLEKIQTILAEFKALLKA